MEIWMFPIFIIGAMAIESLVSIIKTPEYLFGKGDKN